MHGEDASSSQKLLSGFNHFIDNENNNNSNITHLGRNAEKKQSRENEKVNEETEREVDDASSLELPASLDGIKYVIFPTNPNIQIWDIIMIFVLFYYAVDVPYQFGISSGHTRYLYISWLVFNVFLNVLFLIDTFLQFFRAYRDKNGYLICSLKTIRRKYLHGWFLVNLIASLPTTIIIYQAAVRADRNDEEEINAARVLAFFDALKLLRLTRVKKMMVTSEVLRNIWERINVGWALTLKFVFVIMMLSHWIACIWGLVAFLQTGTFDEKAMLSNVNWISNWYNESFVEGGINPIGYDNSFQRYQLCLFWAIQSITSIGYGNIAPVTVFEYVVANTLMLVSGVFWAYVIGNLVEAVSYMGSVTREYISRMEQANEMVDDFTMKKLPRSLVGATTQTQTSKRVRRFITNQRDLATKRHLDSHNGSTLMEMYPALEALSPELRKMCVLHLVHTFIETIPYLSSKFLSPEQQAKIAFECVILEFASGEKFSGHPQMGRGILIIQKGFAVASRVRKNSARMWRKSRPNCPIEVNEVLVEDNYYRKRQLIFRFIGYTKAIFIPRSTIMEVLKKNMRAWKECARWRYFQAALVLHGLQDRDDTLGIV